MANIKLSVPTEVFKRVKGNIAELKKFCGEENRFWFQSSKGEVYINTVDSQKGDFSSMAVTPALAKTCTELAKKYKNQKKELKTT